MRLYISVLFLTTISFLSIPNRLLSFSNIHRAADRTFEKCKMVRICTLNRYHVVTATRTTDLKLKLALWRVEDSGSLTLKGTATAGKVFEIDICALGTQRFVTALRSEQKNLRLIAWRATSSGAIKRLGSAEAGAASNISLTAIGDGMVVTAMSDSNRMLKLISWFCPGTIKRLKSFRGKKINDVKVCRAKLGGSRYVVAATRNTANKLEVSNWSVSTAGTFKLYRNVKRGFLNKLSITPVSYGRFVVAGTDNKSRLRMLSWNIKKDGALSLQKIAVAGKATQVSLASLAATRAITAIRQGGGSLKIINWDTVDGIKRLGASQAGAIRDVAVCTVGDDKIVTAVMLPSFQLKLILWNEHAISLLKGHWGKNKVVPLKPKFLPSPSKPRRKLKLSKTKLRPRLLKKKNLALLKALQRPKQTMEAYGNTQKQSPPPDHIYANLRWTDREPRIAVGTKYLLVISGGGLIEFRDRSGNRLKSKHGEKTTLSANELFECFVKDEGNHNINRHLNRPTNVTYYSKANIDTFYDTRTFFDHSSKRFFIVTNSRKQGLLYKDTTAYPTPRDLMVRRYLAFAVSKTEDPRDGFHLYITTENACFDWPRFTVANGLLFLTHRGSRFEKDGITPSCKILDIRDLRMGNRHPKSFKIYPSTMANGDVVPVNHYGNTKGWNHILKARKGQTKVTIFSFKTPGSFRHLPKIEKSSATLGGPAFFSIRTPPTFRNDKLHLLSVRMISKRVYNKRPARLSVRYMRLPVAYGPSGTPLLRGPGSPSFIDTWFGKSALEDSPGDLVSYEIPALAVNKHDHVLIVYGRIGVKTENVLYPEARYSIFYGDSRGLYRSRLLKAGDFRPKKKHTVGGKEETVETPITPNGALSSVNADVDPTNDETLWMIHAFGSKRVQNYEPVIGKVKP